MQIDYSILFLGIFLISTLVQLIYQWFFLSRLIFYKPKTTKAKTRPVSVIICAKNEYSNLKKHLPFVLEQKYPDFEVVVVDDQSNDGSVELLKEFKEKYPHLKVVRLNENVNFFKGKKLPLSLGIKSAKHEFLILTDADCKPASVNWISKMQKNFSNKHEVVLGYGAYLKKKGFLNSLIRFDTLTTAMNYCSFALAKIPYMGVGRNLAYKKNLFYKAGGFTSHYRVSSGDDDLFINQVANRNNTSVEIRKESFTYSVPKDSFKEWFLQKKRHFSTGKHYKKKHKFILGLIGLSNFSFYVTLILILLFTNYWIWGITMLIIRTMGLMINYFYSEKLFNEKILFLYSPLYDIIFSLLNPIISITDLLYSRNKWK